MKHLLIVVLLITPGLVLGQISQEEANKQVLLKFYQDLWGSNNTHRYLETVAETYIVHDIGDRKNVVEPAVRQKEIADQFWDNGELAFRLDYQVAEDDLVVTRWVAEFEPNTLKGSLLFGKSSIPIINVARVKNGKIIEFWNHRHDIDSGQTMKFTVKGFGLGLICGILSMFIVRRLTGRRKQTVREG